MPKTIDCNTKKPNIFITGLGKPRPTQPQGSKTPGASAGPCLQRGSGGSASSHPGREGLQRFQGSFRLPRKFAGVRSKEGPRKGSQRFEAKGAFFGQIVQEPPLNRPRKGGGVLGICQPGTSGPPKGGTPRPPKKNQTRQQ